MNVFMITLYQMNLKNKKKLLEEEKERVLISVDEIKLKFQKLRDENKLC